MWKRDLSRIHLTFGVDLNDFAFTLPVVPLLFYRLRDSVALRFSVKWPTVQARQSATAPWPCLSRSVGAAEHTSNRRATSNTAV